MDLPEELRRFVPAFDTLFLDVKGGDEQDFLSQNHPFGWLLSVIRREHASKEEFEQALRTAVEYLSELPPEEFPQWNRAIFYLILLIFHRRPPKEQRAFLALVSEGTQERKWREEVEKMIQTGADELIQRGEERGEKRGALRAKREDVLKIMQVRFDSVPEKVVKKVKSIRSMSRLDALVEKAAIANSISDIEID